MKWELIRMSARNPESKKVLITHPTGNSNVRQAVLALFKAGRLDEFDTTIAWRPGSLLDRLLPAAYQSLFSRRSYRDIPEQLVRSHPMHEMARLLSIRLGLSRLHRNETGLFCFEAMTDALDRVVAESLARRSRSGQLPAAVYAYDGCALDTFTEARKHGIRCLYEVPVSYYRSYSNLVKEETESSPEWASTWTGYVDSAEKLRRKEREIELADALFVASTYSAKALQSCPGARDKTIFTIPYGAPPVGPARELTRREDPLRILYVGSLSQRKGISYLFAAMDQLEFPYQLTIVGRASIYPQVLRDALGANRWIETAHHDQVLQTMREHDVLVFPTLTDGFGLVILEAMAQGAVVISTANSAAPDVIQNGINGLIVPIQSSAAIAQGLTHLHDDRSYLATMSEAARQAAQVLTWESYRRQWSHAVDECLLP